MSDQAKDNFTGWICGNNYRKRGRVLSQVGKPNGEPWYLAEDGKAWSSFDVTFYPDKPTTPAEPVAPARELTHLQKTRFENSYLRNWRDGREYERCHSLNQGVALNQLDQLFTHYDAALQRIAALEAQLSETAKDKAYLAQANIANEWEDRYQIQQEKIAALERECAELRKDRERPEQGGKAE